MVSLEKVRQWEGRSDGLKVAGRAGVVEA